MENKKSGLMFVLVVVIAVLCLLVGLLFGSKITNQKEAQENVNNNEVIDKFETDKEGINNKNVYEIKTLKNVQDVISDNDTNAQKAQKIAKEVMEAVNNKDWYYLAKMVGRDTDDFIKYGIYNYNIDVNNYTDREGVKYIFFAKYDWDKTKLSALEDVALGTMLVITFEDGGRINIDPNCTGA